MDEKQCVNEETQLEYTEPGVSIQVQNTAFLFSSGYQATLILAWLGGGNHSRGGPQNNLLGYWRKEKGGSYWNS